LCFEVVGTGPVTASGVAPHASFEPDRRAEFGI
jgi:hypothetical protein